MEFGVSVSSPENITNIKNEQGGIDPDERKLISGNELFNDECVFFKGFLKFSVVLST